jgi:hypothetical protein
MVSICINPILLFSHIFPLITTNKIIFFIFNRKKNIAFVFPDRLKDYRNQKKKKKIFFHLNSFQRSEPLSLSPPSAFADGANPDSERKSKKNINKKKKKD